MGCGCNGYNNDINPYMQMMNMPQQYAPMMTMPQEELETMYPQVYFIVYPAVMTHCDMMGIRPGMMFTPTRQQLDSMVDGIYRSVEGQMGMGEETIEETRQPFGFGPGLGFGFGRRRFARDLIGILLIRELLRRRHFGYPGY